MASIISNVAFLSLIISLINIVITIYKWYYSRPHVEFYATDNMLSGFRASTPNEYSYRDSKCIAFYYVKIANLSDLPCTISECTLFVDGYKPSISSARVEIRSFYDINSIHNTDCNGLHIVEQHISKKLCLQLPLTIPPLGYAEGFIVFPFCPEYKEDSLDIEFVAKSARKDFLVYGKLNRY